MKNVKTYKYETETSCVLQDEELNKFSLVNKETDAQIGYIFSDELEGKIENNLIEWFINL